MEIEGALYELQGVDVGYADGKPFAENLGLSARAPTISEEELVSIIEKCRWGSFAEYVGNQRPDMLEYSKKIAKAIISRLGQGKVEK